MIFVYQLKIEIIKAGELAQCIKCWRYKCDDLNSDPKHPCKKSGTEM